MESVYKLLDQKKYKDADESLEKLLTEYPDFGKGWDVLSRLRFKEYKDAKAMDGIFSQLTVTTETKKGKEKDQAQADSISKALLKTLSQLSPSKLAYSKYLFTMRKALLSSDDAYDCSAKLRNLNVDVDVDTMVNKKALKYYADAEEEFGKKNYDNAAKLYKRALEEQPDFYKAGLYLADCFYFTQNYPAAAEAFKNASNRFPALLEPRKYLIDSYAKQKLYDKCISEAIACMSVYPDLSVVVKMDDAAYLLDKKFSFKWTPRAVFPNVMRDTTESAFNVFVPKEERKVPEPWTFYQASFEKIKPFCDQNGIVVQANSLTGARYMEVFGWEEMLRNSKDPLLDEARAMQKDGYLDCYVLVTCFHYDFYEQYLDFASKQKEKITAYYSKYLVNKN